MRHLLNAPTVRYVSFLWLFLASLKEVHFWYLILNYWNSMFLVMIITILYLNQEYTERVLSSLWECLIRPSSLDGEAKKSQGAASYLAAFISRAKYIDIRYVGVLNHHIAYKPQLIDWWRMRVCEMVIKGNDWDKNWPWWDWRWIGMLWWSMYNRDDDQIMNIKMRILKYLSSYFPIILIFSVWRRRILLEWQHISVRMSIEWDCRREQSSLVWYYSSIS